MLSSRKNRQRGSILNSLLLISVISFIVLMIGTMVSYLSKTTQKKITATRASVQYASAIESLLIAYRSAEFKYLQFMQACPTAQPFMNSLKLGYGGDVSCNPGSLSIFTGTDDGTTAGLYNYPMAGGCTISKTGSTCVGTSTPLVSTTVNNSVRAIATIETHGFYLTTANPERQLAEFTALQTNSDNSAASKYAFALKSSLSNAAHLEPDGRVTQETPDPLAYCPGTKWATFLIFEPVSLKCLAFSQLGSGTGLAYYNDHYFGFRPFDGQVIDMLAASTGSGSYLVDENGTIAGSTTKFVPYNKSWLVNMDDITVIGKQVYYVGKQGVEAEVGVLDNSSGTFVRKPLCAIGQMGWAQAYEGIAALGFSDPLLPVTGDGLNDRIGRFFLKTSGGDLISLTIAIPNLSTTPICALSKDPNLQQIEYKRTYGFDRTNTSKPYILY